MATDIDGMYVAITEALSEYSEETAEEIKAAVKEVARDCKNEIQKRSPRKTGAYRKGWRNRTAFENRDNIRVEIYNKDRGYLTHLLENGHAKVNGGRVAGIPHIAPAEQKAKAELQQRIEAILRK